MASVVVRRDSGVTVEFGAGQVSATITFANRRNQ
jgi:hypothetical protein